MDQIRIIFVFSICMYSGRVYLFLDHSRELRQLSIALDQLIDVEQDSVSRVVLNKRKNWFIITTVFYSIAAEAIKQLDWWLISRLLY